MKKNHTLVAIPECNMLFEMTIKDKALFSACSADAYQNYPLMQYFFGKKENYKTLYTLWNANLSALFGKTYIFSESQNVSGVVIFAKCNFTGVYAVKFLLHGGLKLLPYIPKMLAYEAYAEKLKKKHTKNDDYYLYDLAVKKEFQGQKIASKLLKPIIAFLDKNKKSCYLETHAEKNISLYEHFGFKLVEKGIVPGSNLPHYSMLRLPKTVVTE